MWILKQNHDGEREVIPVLKSELKQIMEYTSLAWKGNFTEDELQENLEDMWSSYKKCCDANEFTTEDTINIFGNLMLQDIYGNIQIFDEDVVFTLEKFEETVKQYINYIVNGNMDFSKLRI